MAELRSAPSMLRIQRRTIDGGNRPPPRDAARSLCDAVPGRL
jgi:hypothetical protein